jgi:hypothetical protein
MPEKNCLNIYTVYYNPSDYPNKWVVRRSEVMKPLSSAKIHNQEIVYVGNKEGLDKIKKEKFSYLHTIPRDPCDDPVIVECWL